jgi:hypothetical protein
MTITLTREEAKQVLDAEALRCKVDYNPETGLMTLKASGKGFVTGRVVGHLHHKGYLIYTFKGRKFGMHRLAWLHYYGKWPDHEIDHINGNKSDNRICNLRDVPKTLNMQNRPHPLPNNKLGITGVKAKNGRFQAQIRVDGRMKHLGMFDTPDEASEAYKSAKIKFHAGYIHGQ